MGTLQVFRVELAFPSFSCHGSVGLAGKMGALLVFRVELFLVSFSWHGSREMAQHPLLVESTSVQFLAPTWWLPTIYNSSNRRTDTYF